MSNNISLTLGLSPVMTGPERQYLFKGFHPADKPLKRLAYRSAFTIRLKPGADENTGIVTHIYHPQ
jgi:hypothetical protein